MYARILIIMVLSIDNQILVKNLNNQTKSMSIYLYMYKYQCIHAYILRILPIIQATPSLPSKCSVKYNEYKEEH